MLKPFITSIVLAALTIKSSAQTIIHKDPEISACVQEVSQDSLKAYISQLVSFGTRSTLSSITELPSKGQTRPTIGYSLSRGTWTPGDQTLWTPP